MDYMWWASILPISGFIGISVLELDRGTRQSDGQTDRQTDRHRPSLHNAASLRRSGPANQHEDRWTRWWLSGTCMNCEYLWEEWMKCDCQHSVRVTSQLVQVGAWPYVVQVRLSHSNHTPANWSTDCVYTVKPQPNTALSITKQLRGSVTER